MAFPKKVTDKFTKPIDMSDLPTDVIEECRYHRTPKHLRVHATSVENLPDIVKDGILPRCKSGCYVWGGECIPYFIQKEGRDSEVLDCREENIFFWDDYYEGAMQGMATVGYVGRGNPAILVVDVAGLKLEPDVEVGEADDCEPQAEMVEGEIEPYRIKCVCMPKEEYLPDLGKVLCESRANPHRKCVSFDADTLFESIGEPSNWECLCREEFEL